MCVAGVLAVDCSQVSQICKEVSYAMSYIDEFGMNIAVFDLFKCR
jgi:hypothetical protein